MQNIHDIASHDQNFECTTKLIEQNHSFEWEKPQFSFITFYQSFLQKFHPKQHLTKIFQTQYLHQFKKI